MQKYRDPSLRCQPPNRGPIASCPRGALCSLPRATSKRIGVGLRIRIRHRFPWLLCFYFAFAVYIEVGSRNDPHAKRKTPEVNKKSESHNHDNNYSMFPVASPIPADTVVVLKTSEGDIDIELYPDDAPLACHNFVALAARAQYFNNTIFHRVSKGFVIQGGDPTGTGTGGQSCFGHWFPDEFSPRLRHTGAGIVSCASAGPDCNGSQFTITLAPCPSLDGVSTIFGRVARGMAVVERIASLQTDAADRPFTTVRIVEGREERRPRQRRPEPDSFVAPSRPSAFAAFEAEQAERARVPQPRPAPQESPQVTGNARAAVFDTLRNLAGSAGHQNGAKPKTRQSEPLVLGLRRDYGESV